MVDRRLLSDAWKQVDVLLRQPLGERTLPLSSPRLVTLVSQGRAPLQPLAEWLAQQATLTESMTHREEEHARRLETLELLAIVEEQEAQHQHLLLDAPSISTPSRAPPVKPSRESPSRIPKPTPRLIRPLTLDELASPARSNLLLATPTSRRTTPPTSASPSASSAHDPPPPSPRRPSFKPHKGPLPSLPLARTSSGRPSNMGSLQHTQQRDKALKRKEYAEQVRRQFKAQQLQKHSAKPLTTV